MLNASKQFKPQLKPRSLTFLPLEPLLVFSEDYFVLLDAGLVACWPLAAALNLTKTFGIHVQIVILILQFINRWHLRFKLTECDQFLKYIYSLFLTTKSLCYKLFLNFNYHLENLNRYIRYILISIHSTHETRLRYLLVLLRWLKHDLLSSISCVTSIYLSHRFESFTE